MRTAKREAFRALLQSSACQNHYHLFSEADASQPLNVRLMLLKWHIILYTEFDMDFLSEPVQHILTLNKLIRLTVLIALHY